MADGELAGRFLDFFMRQMAWLERMRNELDGLDADLDAAAFDKLLQQQAGYAEETRRFEAEFAGLSAEWHASRDVTPEDRDTVRVLAQEARMLAAELAGKHEQARQRAGRCLDAVQDALNALQRGHDVLRKYRIPDSPEGDLMDKKA
jgi:hypothetical protein